MAQGASGSALLKGGRIVDGTNAPAFAADVRVVDGRIVEIGPDLVPGAEPVYDAAGCYVTPGFIDSHTHYDGSLFWDAACDPIPQHGVTTVVIGNCGLGLAPIRSERVPQLIELFSYIEDLPRDVFHAEIPWNWQTFGEYADVMRALPLGVNVVSMVSHSLLRTYEVGDEAWQRASAPDEKDRIAGTLDAALAAGAFGLSTSNFDRSPAGDLVPSSFADDDEFDRLFAVVAKHNGIVQVIPDMSSVDRQEDDLRRLGRLSARYGGVPVLSNAIYDRPDLPEYAPRLMTAAKEVRGDGGNFHFLASPRSIELLINFNQTLVFIYVPAWNQIPQPHVPVEEKKRLLADPEWRARARAEWDAVEEGFPSGGVERLFRIIKVGRPEYEQYLGKTFDVILDARGGHCSDVLADWALENELEAEFVYPFTNTDIDAVGRLLAADESLISGSDAGAHIAMFDGAGDTTLVLTRHVRDRDDLTLESAVKRMTADQAAVLGLKDRGTIEVGAIADLAVFDLDALRWEAERKVHDVPGGKPRFRRPEGGFRYTFVSGVPVQREGTLTGETPARFLDSRDRVAA